MRQEHGNSFWSDDYSDSLLLATVGRDLASVYVDVLREPLPERMAELIRKLERADEEPGRGGP